MSTDTFESDLREALATRAAEVPGDTLDRLRHASYRPRAHRRAAIAGAGLAAASAVTAVAVLAIMHPAAHPASAQLDAWTVTKQANGNFLVTIRQLRDPGRLQSELRADGIPASVTFGQPNPACVQYPTTASLQSQVFGIPNTPAKHASTGYSADIDLATLPSGAGVQIALLSESAHQLKGMQRLVYTSAQCTGS